MIEQLRLLLQQITTLEFWQGLLAGFQGLGPVVPIVLAALESFIPAKKANLIDINCQALQTGYDF